jgi:hypothetical protein
MKDLNEMTNKELVDMMFSNPNDESEIAKDNRRRRELAKTDLTYKKYPATNVLTGEFQGYPFKGWSKEEIEDYIENYDEIIKEIFK